MKKGEKAPGKIDEHFREGMIRGGTKREKVDGKCHLLMGGCGKIKSGYRERVLFGEFIFVDAISNFIADDTTKRKENQSNSECIGLHLISFGTDVRFCTVSLF